MERKIVVVGGGPAGIEAALAAARAGQQVILISDGPVGGRSTWHSLLPSKVWLSSVADPGHVAGLSRLTKPTAEVDKIIDKIKRVKENWHGFIMRELQQAGVAIVQGTASFIGSDKLQLVKDDDQTYEVVEGDAFIIASGSIPIFPPALKPDGRRVIAPRFASHLNELPQTMLVIGAGVTGCETAYLFNACGVEVTWIVDQFGILPSFHLDLGLAMGRAMVRQGVRLIQGQMVKRLERDEQGVTAVLMDGARYEGQKAFVAIGRKPDWGRINLEAAGVTPQKNGVYAGNEFGQTAVSHIYLVGDASGGEMVANKAMAQGRIAGRHASGMHTAGYRPQCVVQVAYSDPEAAQVGQVGPGEGVQAVRVPYHSSLKAHLLDNGAGFVEVNFDKSSRRLLGGIAFGVHASSTLTPVALAIELDATVDQLAQIYAAHPTIDELAFAAARKA
ncbi:MAG: NAD(P)/FAD-dependent oxidoreductase [Candidatus Promineifilaceae bacterium]|nr:NAD(P)/FAD-dependent oxidoreductase [Candidatus Promineifilaceae bacterium]